MSLEEVQAAVPIFPDEESVIEPAPTSYNWNLFRYIADFTHLAGIAILLHYLNNRKTCAGLSWKTQILYFWVYVTRYLDLLDHVQTLYLVFFKITYIATSSAILIMFRKYSNAPQGAVATYEEDKDTVSMLCIVVPCFLAACILTRSKEILEIFWTFSEYLEGFAMVPQYVFCYRENAQTQQKGPLLFILSFGLYRVFYAFNWMYKFAMVSGYRDFQSWLGGLFEIAFFIDFLSYQLRQTSVLRSLVLLVDDRVNETVEKMELKVMGEGRRDAIERKKNELSQMRQRRVLGAESYDVVQMQDQL